MINNKKFFRIMVVLIMVLSLCVTGCKKDTEKKVVRLNEVVHSIFYAPQYVALENGYFEEEGLSIELSTGWGADKSMTALISDHADIALMGPEASIYVYNEGQENYAVSFAQLTKRAGNFLIGREYTETFDWASVKGKTIIGGRKGGMPQMVLEYILKKNDIEPYTDVEIITNIDFSATAGAFVGGSGDFTAEFEPTASKLEAQGQFVVASLGVESGNVPYTAYMATKEYINDHEDIVQSFTNGIYKGEVFVKNHTALEIAEVIAPYFEETDLEDLEQIVERYKVQGTWCEHPLFEEDSLYLLEDILETAGELDGFVDYEVIVEPKFANKVK